MAQRHAQVTRPLIVAWEANSTCPRRRGTHRARVFRAGAVASQHIKTGTHDHSVEFGVRLGLFCSLPTKDTLKETFVI
jgi:hypothetical protein